MPRSFGGFIEGRGRLISCPVSLYKYRRYHRLPGRVCAAHMRIWCHQNATEKMRRGIPFPPLQLHVCCPLVTPTCLASPHLCVLSRLHLHVVTPGVVVVVVVVVTSAKAVPFAQLQAERDAKETRFHPLPPRNRLQYLLLFYLLLF